MLVENNLPALRNVLDDIMSEYSAKQLQVKELCEFVLERIPALESVGTGYGRVYSTHLPSGKELFNYERTIKVVDAEFWNKIMTYTDVLECMPAIRRDEWNESIRKCETPKFERETVLATIGDLMMKRESFFAERVDGLFRSLSGDHVTNQPQGFAKRMILASVFNHFCDTKYRASAHINDLRTIIAKFNGRAAPAYYQTADDLGMMQRRGTFGEWLSFDGGALRMRIYKKGTAHLEIHPDVVYRLNMVLHSLYPKAIPPEFRSKPKKAAKEHRLENEILDYNTMCELSSLKWHGDTICFVNSIGFIANKVLLTMGGVANKRVIDKREYRVLEFDYLARSVIDDISRNGVMPESKSHQFYPTPESVAVDAVAWAGIENHHNCLEPSAGLGDIAKHMPQHTHCVEVSEIRCNALRARGLTVKCGDFLEHKGEYDRIVMNPPFSDGRWQAHVKHAASLLNDNGVLVAVLPSSANGKMLVDGMTHEYSGKYKDEFSGTSVSVILLKLTK